MPLGPNIKVSIILFKGKVYADGCHPIMLQYYFSGKSKRKVIHRCLPDQWDHKNNRVRSKVPNSSIINMVISEAFLDAERSIMEVRAGNCTLKSLFEPANPLTLGEALNKEMERYKSELKPVPYERINSYRTQLQAYCKVDDLNLCDMDLRWFEQYVKKMRDLGNCGSTIQKKMKTIRAIVQRYSEKQLDTSIKSFRVASQKHIKQKLTPEEFILIEQLALPDDQLITYTRDLFLMQVYLRGIRIGDVLQARSEDFTAGRFNYITDKGNKDMGLKLIPKAQQIVDKYHGRFERLFPFFKWKEDKKLSAFENKQQRLAVKEACTTIVNKYLKEIAKMAKIEKPLTTHIARHTFARMAIDKIKNPMVTMELLGHSSLSIHQGYLNDIRKDDVLDQAADDIFEV